MKTIYFKSKRCVGEVSLLLATTQDDLKFKIESEFSKTGEEQTLKIIPDWEFTDLNSFREFYAEIQMDEYCNAVNKFVALISEQNKE